MGVQTTRGKAQEATLQRWTSTPVEVITADTYEDVLDLLTESLAEAMRHASSDGRSRRATARGSAAGVVLQLVVVAVGACSGGRVRGLYVTVPVGAVQFLVATVMWFVGEWL